MVFAMEPLKGGAEIPRCIVRISVADMVALRVRTRGEQHSAMPEFLYQGLPMKALSLMTTLPRGSFAVSIPGYSIQKSPPSSAEGFVLVYALRPNWRYEAVEVHHQSRIIKIAEFCELAERLLESQIGELKTQPDQFAYLAPTRELWGVIQRDDGYIALDPTKVERSITQALERIRQGLQTSGVIVRVPIKAGDQQIPLPTFERVELTLDPKPSPHSLWIRYEEYQKFRALESRPPDSVIAAFREWLQQFTLESGFDSWIFHPGMLFGDRIEWWGDRNRRRTEHEGLDFVEGRRADGQICSVAEGMRIRAMAPGEVVSILQDFLRQTVVIRHTAVTNETGSVFHTLYSHIQPETGLLGKGISKGQVLGQLGKDASYGAPPHFHLAAAWIPQSIKVDELTLDHIHPGFAPVVLINFNSIATCDREVI